MVFERYNTSLRREQQEIHHVYAQCGLCQYYLVRTVSHSLYPICSTATPPLAINGQNQPAIMYTTCGERRSQKQQGPNLKLFFSIDLNYKSLVNCDSHHTSTAK